MIRGIIRSVVRPAIRPAVGAEVLGDDLIVNGGFASDTIWTKGAPWTISSGVATCAGTGGLSQAIALAADAIYRVTFTITAYTSGGVRPRFTGGTTVDGALCSALGTYTQDVATVAGSTTFVMNGASFFGAIDNVSVRRVLY